MVEVELDAKRATYIHWRVFECQCFLNYLHSYIYNTISISAMTQIKTGFWTVYMNVKVVELLSVVVFQVCNLHIKPTYSNVFVGQNAYSGSGWCGFVRKLP